MKIVGLGGSLGLHSSSLAALEIALEGAAQTGAETQLLDIRRLDLPFYVPGATTIPASVHEVCQAVHSADGLIWSSPLYHGTISGAFKNALDWLETLRDRRPPYLTDKVVGLISTAGGVQGLQAVNTMEFVVRALRGWQAFDEDGRAREPEIEAQLHTLGGEVARAARQFTLGRITTPAAQAAEDAIMRSDDE